MPASCNSESTSSASNGLSSTMSTLIAARPSGTQDTGRIGNDHRDWRGVGNGREGAAVRLAHGEVGIATPERDMKVRLFARRETCSPSVRVLLSTRRQPCQERRGYALRNSVLFRTITRSSQSQRWRDEDDAKGAIESGYFSDTRRAGTEGHSNFELIAPCFASADEARETGRIHVR